MKLFRLAFLFALLALAPAVCAQISGPASAIRFGPTDPSTCQAGQGLVFINTTSGLFKQCNTTDTWTAIAGAGSGDALVANPLSQFAPTTSAELAGVITNETGSSLLVFNTSPTLVTPVLGVAAATSINGLILTASTGTFTLTNGKTFAVTHGLTLSGTDSTVMTFPTTSATIARTDAANTFTGLQTMTTPSFTTGFTIGGAATSRKVIVGNGTNFVASTETYAVPGTSGNVLTSDGTNWTSAAPAGGGLTVGTTAITSGTGGRLAYETSGNKLGEISGVTSDGASLTALPVAGVITQTSASATAFASGLNGATNPVLLLVNNVASQATGISITGRAAAAGVDITAVSSGTDESMKLLAKGAGGITLSGGSTTIQDTTASTGSTNAIIKAGAGQGAFSSLLTFQAADASSLARFQYVSASSARLQLVQGGGTTAAFAVMNSNAYADFSWYVEGLTGSNRMRSNGGVFWSNGTDAAGTLDLGLTRNGVGVAEINNGSAGGFGALMYGRVVTAKTTDFTITAALKQTLYTNSGAAGTVNLTLPTAAAGLQYGACRVADFSVTLVAGASTTIRIGASVSAAAGNVSLDAVGTCVHLVALSTTEWYGQSFTGTIGFH